MLYLPMAIAFVVAAAGAFVIGAGAATPWGAILVGATLAAAMSGIVTSVLQFLPSRLFMPFSLLSSVVVAMLVAASMNAVAKIGFRPLEPSSAFVWAIAAIVALVASRASGMRLPPLRRRGSWTRRG